MDVPRRYGLGHLVFYFKRPIAGSFEGAVVAVARTQNPESIEPFHVAIFVADDVLVHAIPAGVVKNSLRESIDRLVPDFIEIWRLDPEVVGAEALNSAAQFLVSRLGCAYNDIFSDNCRNSEGQEAFIAVGLAAVAQMPVKLGDRVDLTFPAGIKYVKKGATDKLFACEATDRQLACEHWVDQDGILVAESSRSRLFPNGTFTIFKLRKEDLATYQEPEAQKGSKSAPRAYDLVLKP
ncbi:unnamed protein product, partial [Mesorhabditis spiculigera]